MAESMFEKEQSRKTWRMVVIGAAVPFAMLAAAPAVSAADIDQVETAGSEQVPPMPVDPPVASPTEPPAGQPDPQALLDLQQCLTDVQALLSADVPADAPADVPAEADQLPSLPDPGAAPPQPAAPDVVALNQTCQEVLTVLQGQDQAPGVPADPPVEVPVEPED